MTARRGNRRLTLLGALLLASCGGRGAAPRITVDSAVVELGRLYRGEVRAHTFVIGNTGGARLQIEDVRKECVCTLPHLTERAVEPGKSITIDCELHAKLNPGKYEKSVTVRSNDAAQPELKLSFVFEVAELYQVEPRVVDFGPTLLGKEVGKDCRVRLLEGTKLVILGAEADDGLFSAAWTIDPQDATSAQLRITLSGKAPIGIVTKTVTLLSDHPRQPRIPIPVTAEVTAPLSFEPASALNLGEFPRAQGASGVVVVRNLDRDHPLQIESAAVERVSSSRLASARVETVVEGMEFRVVVTVEPGFTERNFFGQLEIRTNVAACRSQSVAIFGTAKE